MPIKYQFEDGSIILFFPSLRYVEWLQWNHHWKADEVIDWSTEFAIPDFCRQVDTEDCNQLA